MSDIRTPFTQQPARGAPMRQQYGQFAYAQPSVPVGYAQPFPQATGPQRAYATAYQQALRARAANGRITYGDILTDQAMASYTARVNGVSTIIIIMSALSLFFGVIIFSSLGVLTGCLQLRPRLRRPRTHRQKGNNRPQYRGGLPHRRLTHPRRHHRHGRQLEQHTRTARRQKYHWDATKVPQREATP